MFMHSSLRLPVAFFCFFLFPEFENFVLYSYGVAHDFHDDLRDTFRRKMASGDTVAHGNSPSRKQPFGFCSWSLPSQSQFAQTETRKCCPNVPNTLKDEDSSKNLWCFFRKISGKLWMQASLLYDTCISTKGLNLYQDCWDLYPHRGTLDKLLNLV